MKIFLYDSMKSLPQNHQSNILVFGGKGSLLKADERHVVTEIHCTHHVGDNIVRFLHNGNASELRFERALAWAVKYAAQHGVQNIYGVFELDRSLDDLYLKKICPKGIVDRRQFKQNANLDAASHGAGEWRGLSPLNVVAQHRRQLREKFRWFWPKPVSGSSRLIPTSIN